MCSMWKQWKRKSSENVKVEITQMFSIKRMCEHDDENSVLWAYPLWCDWRDQQESTRVESSLDSYHTDW